ncbi:hypothetical protein F5Y04DRAFT_283516 [Hypomontagnella monticulosa]|nr:hypothetical protein F5Y04DRAFT_283516 [Hypomontagnella monticulosa]
MSLPLPILISSPPLLFTQASSQATSSLTLWRVGTILARPARSTRHQSDGLGGFSKPIRAITTIAQWSAVFSYDPKKPLSEKADTTDSGYTSATYADHLLGVYARGVGHGVPVHGTEDMGFFAKVEPDAKKADTSFKLIPSGIDQLLPNDEKKDVLFDGWTGWNTFRAWHMTRLELRSHE